MKVSVLRQAAPTTEPYWESFEYDGSADNSVAGVLDYINYHDDIVNAEGKGTARIGWECSCLQGVCGSCAMVINGVPALACETLVRDLKKDTIEIRPLRKFPVIHDLIVDRSSIHENLTQTNVFIGEYRPSADGDHAHQYAAAKCLKCGLCLEVCPNYVNGRIFSARPSPTTAIWSHQGTTQRRRRLPGSTGSISAGTVPNRFRAWTYAR